MNPLLAADAACCPSRVGSTYTVDQATNIKWYEGAVSRRVTAPLTHFPKACREVARKPASTPLASPLHYCDAYTDAELLLDNTAVAIVPILEMDHQRMH